MKHTYRHKSTVRLEPYSVMDYTYVCGYDVSCSDIAAVTDGKLHAAIGVPGETVLFTIDIQCRVEYDIEYSMGIDAGSNNGDILVGYKGSQFVDSGYFYAPYVPLMIDPSPDRPSYDAFVTRKYYIGKYGHVRWVFDGVKCLGIDDSEIVPIEITDPDIISEVRKAVSSYINSGDDSVAPSPI